MNIPFWYYVAIITLLIFLLVTTKKPRISILAAYLVFIFALAVLSRRPIYSKVNWIPFKSYRKGLTKQVAANILAFIPLGFLLRKKCYGLLISILIELAQLLLHRGYCDIDDVISNTIGLFIGTVLSFLFHATIRVWKQREASMQ